MKLIFVQENDFFLKPDTALLRNNDPFYLPDFADEFTFATHIAVRVTRLARAIEEKFAHRCYDEAGLGVDFTAADLLRKCRAEGLPWEAAKAFDKSAAVSPRFLPKDVLNALMLNEIDRAIAFISRLITLRMGDLIFVGAPLETGILKQGDRLVGQLGGEELINMQIE